MDALEVLREVLDDLFPALEAMESQNAALLQFLIDRGIASDRDLAPFREKAAITSNVRWRAVQVRVHHLIEGAVRAAEAAEEKSREAAEAEKKKVSPPDRAEQTAGQGGEPMPDQTKKDRSGPDQTKSSDTKTEQLGPVPSGKQTA